MNNTTTHEQVKELRIRHAALITYFDINQRINEKLARAGFDLSRPIMRGEGAEEIIFRQVNNESDNQD